MTNPRGDAVAKVTHRAAMNETGDRPRQVRRWLGASALTIGVTAVLLSGATVADADTGSGASNHSTTSGHAAAHKHSASHQDPSTTGSVAHPPAQSTTDTAPVKHRGDKKRDTAHDTKKQATTNPAAASTEPATTGPAPVPAAAAATTHAAAVPAAATTTAAATTASTTASTTTTTAVVKAPALHLPTPQQVLRDLQNFGNNIATTITHQIDGIKNSLSDLSADLARMLGFKQVVVIPTAPYGDPTTNSQYWTQAENPYTNALAVVAMAWAQLSGTAVDLDSFIEAAETTDSLYRNGQTIYNPSSNTYVALNDALDLLQSKGVSIVNSLFAQGQSSQALSALTAGLADPSKVMLASINSSTTGYRTVVVLGVNTATDTVTLNDSTQAAGQATTMSLSDFMSEWSGVNYSLSTAQLTATAGSTTFVAPTNKTVWVWGGLPALNRIGSALQSFANNVGLTVVHQIDTAGENLDQLSEDLVHTFGLQHLIAAAAPALGDLEHGNYAGLYQYFIYQGRASTCAIMAVAAVIGQLTGIMPTQSAILAQAQSTPSDTTAGESIIVGNGNVAGYHYGTSSVDVVKLLGLNGISAKLSNFLRSQGQLALDTLDSALDAGQSALVAINADMAWDAYVNTFKTENYQAPPPASLSSNHMVTVIAVDLSKNVVYVNDSAWPNGQGFPIPLNRFLEAWQTSSYTLITAELAGAAPAITAAA